MAGASDSQDCNKKTGSQDASSVRVNQVMVDPVKFVKTINVKGFIVPLKKISNSVVGFVKPYYDKLRRAPLSEEHYLELTDKETLTQFPKFDLLVLAL